MRTDPQQPLSKSDKFVYAKIDTASKEVRTLAHEIAMILENLRVSHPLIKDIANQMKNISTIEIVELPDAVEEGMKKMQKLNAHLMTDAELAKKLLESDLKIFITKTQDFNQACIKLSEEAIKFEDELNS